MTATLYLQDPIDGSTLGAVVPLSLAWTLGDVFLGLVIIPNLIALILLTPKVVELTRSYFERKPWTS